MQPKSGAALAKSELFPVAVSARTGFDQFALFPGWHRSTMHDEGLRNLFGGGFNGSFP
jgi:hypothetical protein